MKFDLNVEGRLSPESAAEVAGTALALPAAESLDA